MKRSFKHLPAFSAQSAFTLFAWRSADRFCRAAGEDHSLVKAMTGNSMKPMLFIENQKQTSNCTISSKKIDFVLKLMIFLLKHIDCWLHMRIWLFSGSVKGPTVPPPSSLWRSRLHWCLDSEARKATSYSQHSNKNSDPWATHIQEIVQKNYSGMRFARISLS